MQRQKQYPVDSFVYYRDNDGDMIIAKIVTRSACGGYLTVKPKWYAAEPVVHLPLRAITTNRKLARIPLSIIEKADLYAPE
jgi:hypothetical protein